ncbi:conserved hypothetical protein [Phenylobacterium zucineum HLK1]|uniref:Uncharacterized protein n=1 Tax=Phenylobacterium zucineum (strain HLK1) TaxID=450851 RepID=B4RHH5_PHEZH|nr:conserved hypothetical protein [Phenylobacterium zucineum HLK1]
MAASVTPVPGVRVAVQVIPSPLARSLSAPLGTTTSSTVKPLTASVKVKVTVAVSPIFSAVSEMAMPLARAGRWVSTVSVGVAPPAPRLPAASA